MDQHPELKHVVHVLTQRSDGSSESQTFDDYVGDYIEGVWVNKCVRIWADSIAPLALGVRRADGAWVAGHPITQLLASPNPQTTSSDLWRQWATDMGLGGESGFEFVQDARGNFIEIYARQPSYFAVRPDVARSRYGAVASYVMDYLSQQSYVLSPLEFKHFKFYNPVNLWRGLSPISAVRLGVHIDLLVQMWSQRFFQNNARPDFALITPGGLTPTERRDYENKLMLAHSGEENWHRPLVLEQGVTDIKMLSFPRKDLEWLHQRRMSRDEIAAAFGVPDEIAGFGRDTYENFDTAERVLWSLTLVNLIGYRDDNLTHFFRMTGALRAGEAVATDLSRVWALRRASQVQLTDALKLAALGVPFNTIDKKLQLGIGDVPGGDEPRAVSAPAAETERPQKDKSSENERRALREMQDQQLTALRALRASRQLGRGRQALDAVSEVSDDAALRAVLDEGERNGESILALGERINAYYQMRKGER